MKGCKGYIFAILALLMTATVATAQHQHSAPVVVEIDGGAHPEQIPDSTAYFNFFFHRSSPSNTGYSPEMFEAAVHSVGLDAQDELVFRTAMAQFQSQFEAWKVKFTPLAEKGLLKGTDFWTATGGINGIVQQTRVTLEKNLSKVGLVKYEGSVLWMRNHTTAVMQ